MVHVTQRSIRVCKNNYASLAKWVSCLLLFVDCLFVAISLLLVLCSCYVIDARWKAALDKAEHIKSRLAKFAAGDLEVSENLRRAIQARSCDLFALLGKPSTNPSSFNCVCRCLICL